MSLPLDDQKILWYISNLGSQREIESKTIANYITGLRMLHLSLGIHIPSLKTPIVALALKGTKRKQELLKEFQSKPRRRAITLPLLEFLSNQIALDSSLCEFDQQVFHTLSVTGFFGSFRLGT